MATIGKPKLKPAVKHYTFFIGFVVLIALFTFFSLKRIERKTSDAAGEALLDALNSSHAALNLWIEQRHSDIEQLVADPLIIEATSELTRYSENKTILVHHSFQKQLRNYLGATIKRSGDLTYYIIAGNEINVASFRDDDIGEKNQIAGVHPELLRKAFHGECILIPSLNPKISFSNTGDTTGRKYPVMFLMAPVKKKSDSIIAVLAIKINPLEIFSELTRLAQKGNTGDSYAIDKKAFLITRVRFINQLRKAGLLKKDENEILNLRVTDPGGNILKGYKIKSNQQDLPLTFMARCVIHGKKCMNTRGYRDYRGVKVMGAGLWDDELGIGIISEIEVTEALSPYYRVRNIVIGLSLVIVVASFFLFILAFRYRKKEYNQNLQYQQKLESELNKRTKKLKSINKILKEHERNLKLALTGAKAGMFSFHLPSGVLIWDERSIELHGLTAEEFNHNMNTAVKYVSEIDIRRLKMLLRKIKEGEMENLELQYEISKSKDDKRYIQTLGRVERNKKGDALYISGTHTDITKKLMAERALKKSELRFRSLHNMMKQGVIMLDYKGMIKSLNPAAEKILGTDAETILNKIYTDLEWNVRDENDVELTTDKLPLTIALTQGVEVKNVVVKYFHPRTKRYRWLSFTAIPLFGEGAEVPNEVYTVFEDITRQKTILQELRKSEEKYRYLVDYSLIGIFQTNMEGEIIYANKAFSDILEYSSPFELLGANSFLKYHHPGDRDRFIADMEIHGQVNNFECEIVTRKDVVKSVIMNAKSSGMYISGMLHDISARKEYEQSLKRSEENFRRIIEFSPQAMAVTDQNNNILQLNKKFLNLFGYQKTEIKNLRDWWIKAFPDKVYREGIKKMWEKRTKSISEDGTGFEPVEVTVTCKDGTKLWIEIQYVSMDRGKRNLTVFTDLTEKKQVEEALRSSLELNLSMVNYSVPEIINLALEEGVRITQSNIGFFHFVNNDQKTISLQTWSKKTLENCEVLSKEEHYPIDNAGVWVECIKARKPVIHNDYVHIKNKKGLPKGHFPLIRELVVPIFEGKKIVGIIGVGNKLQNYTQFDADQLSLMAENIWNIVRKKRMEDDLLKAKEEAEKANKAKSVFIANMSHEIRTPMNAVLGFADILDHQLNDPVQLNYLKSIKSSGKTLLGLINDVLDLSKIEAGKMEIINEPLDLGDLLKEIKQIFALKTEQRDLSFIINENHCMGYFFLIDELRLRQILLNIVGNAVKFTETGHIQISSETVNIDIKKNTCDLKIKIEDTGIGISKENQKIIFDSFRQQDEQDMRKYGGTGLGLAITKRLVDMMNGSIEVKSELGNGSTFFIAFNEVTYKEKNIAKDEQKNFDSSLIEFGKSRILVVDDVESNRELIRGYFRGTQVEIDLAENGIQALIHVQQNPPDVILMDIRMPEMDGYQTTRKLKENNEFKHIPVIAITASVMDSGKAKMKKFNFEDYIRKPVQLNDLFQILTNYLPYSSIKPKKTLLDKRALVNNIRKISEELKNLMYGTLMKKWDYVRSADNMEEISGFGKELEETGRQYAQEDLENFGRELINYSEIYDIDNTKIMLSSFKEFIDKISDVYDR